jgi:hypothetical protein
MVYNYHKHICTQISVKLGTGKTLHHLLTCVALATAFPPPPPTI